MSLTKLRIQLLLVFLSLAGLFLFFLFKLLPHWGTSLPPLTAGMLTLLVLTSILLSLALIYRGALRLHRKIGKEAANAAETIHRYEALNNATNDAVWDHNLLSGETYYNDQFFKVFGYPREDLVNNESWWLDNIHPDDRERVKQKIDHILDNIDPLWQDEYHFRCKDGSFKMVHDRSYIVRDLTGKPVRLIGAMNDITTERKLQQQIIREQLEHKMNLGKAIIQAHEEERRKIREELHEDVNQALASVKLCMHQFSSRSGKDEALQQSISQLDDVISRIRNIADYLAPPALEYFGLISSVQELIDNTCERYPAIIELQHDEIREEELDHSSRILLYRSIDDLFNIIFPGKQPLHLVVCIRNSDKKPELSITDLSGGLDITQLSGASRIRTIRNKLEMYNGSLQLHFKTRQHSAFHS